MTGIGNYSFYLISALIDLDPTLQFVGFDNPHWRAVTRDSLNEIAAAQGKGFASTKKRGSALRPEQRAIEWAASVLRRFELARVVYRHVRRVQFRRSVHSVRFDLFHALNYQPPIDPGVPTLPVVYDLSFLRYPEFHPQERLRWLSDLPQTIARAPVVQTISEFSRSEIVAMFGYPPERIVVAPPAVAPLFRPLGAEAMQPDLARFDLRPGGYLLAVGTLEPRKNFATLIAAFGEIPAREQSHCPLVIAGGPGWGDLKLPSGSDKLCRQGTLRFLGKVSDPQLRSLYEGARAMLFPSIYEGFGIPVLEALACGTPVVHSAKTAMTEITGGLALEIPALDVAAWTKAIRRSIDPGSGSHPAEQTSRIDRARSFTWRRSAATVASAYNTAIGV